MTPFEEIYQTYFQDVFRYLCRLTGDEKTAEDITASTFFKAMQALPSFRGECDVRVWLFRIAKNTYYSHQKKYGRVESLNEDRLAALPADGSSVEEQALDQSDIEQVRKVLHRIPEPYKEVFMWRVFGCLSFRQIGELFGKTENWACVTFYRAKKQIRQEMGLDV